MLDYRKYKAVDSLELAWLKRYFPNPYFCNLAWAKDKDKLDTDGGLWDGKQCEYLVIFAESSNLIVFEIASKETIKRYVLELANWTHAHLIAMGIKKLSEYYIESMLQAQLDETITVVHQEIK